MVNPPSNLQASPAAGETSSPIDARFSLDDRMVIKCVWPS
ncbi:hypothetical protein Pla52n_01140 [Stieleria varia]|uniref:Uncharacterized protein n=1 Tax=Stieleria varia TaxID=2528005 RepID=A0A5C6B7Z3_9BACT|nr:hypothetical protein Pla52n_01140 [Stieleria varia]